MRFRHFLSFYPPGCTGRHRRSVSESLIVQRAPAYLDLDAGLDILTSETREAARQGAYLVVSAAEKSRKQ